MLWATSYCCYRCDRIYPTVLGYSQVLPRRYYIPIVGIPTKIWKCLVSNTHSFCHYYSPYNVWPVLHCRGTFPVSALFDESKGSSSSGENVPTCGSRSFTCSWIHKSQIQFKIRSFGPSCCIIISWNEDHEMGYKSLLFKLSKELWRPLLMVRIN